jgi:dihydrofolate synthase/folylpolyglutamate synthase
VSGTVATYAETVAWLQALEVASGWDLKLDRMRAALDLRGHPEAGLAAIHVAGTNGKGSTAAMLDAILRAAGRRTGLYTSPHLVDFCERIRVDGRTIPRGDVVALVGELRAALEPAGVRLTHFEFTTLLAFEWLARRRVDVAVVEVGLGGRLDATNVVRPAVTAITSIGLDHEAWLGHDVATIAGEKAGIAKAGVPLVLGRVPREAAATIRARAAAVGAPLVAVGDDATIEPADDGDVFTAPGVRWTGLRIALPGAFQRANAAVALAAAALLPRALAVDGTAVRRGLAAVRWPGRLAVVGERPRVVLDGAHNPDGAAALAGELPALAGTGPVTLVFAAMADKAWPAMLAPLVPHVARVICTRVGRRAADPASLAASLAVAVPAVAVAEPRAALATALATTPADGTVVVTGSLFLVGEAYAALGIRLFEPWKAADTGGTGSPP